MFPFSFFEKRAVYYSAFRFDFFTFLHFFYKKTSKSIRESYFEVVMYNQMQKSEKKSVPFFQKKKKGTCLCVIDIN